LFAIELLPLKVDDGMEQDPCDRREVTSGDAYGGSRGAAAEMAIAVMAFNLKRLGSLLGRTRLIEQLQPI
jgi:hypothetical protein